MNVFRKVSVTAIAVGAFALTLAGCSAPTVAQVQAATEAACGFLPTAASITSLYTQSKYASTAEATAALICGAVKVAGSVSAPVSGVIAKSKSTLVAAVDPVVVRVYDNGGFADIAGHFVR